MAIRKGLFGTVLFFCAPIVIVSSFLLWGSPLALGFQDGVSERLQMPLIMMTYWAFLISVPIAVFGLLPLSAAFATQVSKRKLGFLILIGTTFLLQPTHFLFLHWLTS